MSEIRIEQFSSVGAEPLGAPSADAIVLASGAQAIASAPLNISTRTVFIRCEGVGARVAVLMARGDAAAVPALLSEHTKGSSLNDGERRLFAVPETGFGGENMRIAVIDRPMVGTQTPVSPPPPAVDFTLSNNVVVTAWDVTAIGNLVPTGAPAGVNFLLVGEPAGLAVENG